jgi:hypothetical protein
MKEERIEAALLFLFYFLYLFKPKMPEVREGLSPEVAWLKIWSLQTVLLCEYHLDFEKMLG